MLKVAIIVLGGGITADGNLPVWVESRMETALRIHAQIPNFEFFILSGWGTERPKISEAAVMKSYFINKGITDSLIRLEEKSVDTIGNAYYSRELLADYDQVQKLLVITNEFHLNRTEGIFSWVFPSGYDIEFIAAPNSGINKKDLEVREELEGSLDRYYRGEIFRKIAPGDMKAIDSFLDCKENEVKLAYLEFLKTLKIARTLY